MAHPMSIHRKRAIYALFTRYLLFILLSLIYPVFNFNFFEDQALSIPADLTLLVILDAGYTCDLHFEELLL